jgi:hypothetical protein
VLRMPFKMLNGRERYCCATGSEPSERYNCGCRSRLIIEAVDQFEADELRLLAQRLEERLAGMQH